jgi:hypothetical protein
MAEVTNPTNPANEPGTNEPTVAELQAQLAQVNAEKEQLRNSLTKSNSEAANYKKALREKQTAEEKEAEERAEAQRVRDEEFENMKKELNHNKALSAYKSISDEKIVDGLIDAVTNADHNAIAQIIAKECEKAVAVAKQTWLDGRPEVNYGGSPESKTKSEIMKVKDASERQRLIAENMDLF